MEDLLGMGFPEHQCRKALREVSSVPAAVGYITRNADKPENWWRVCSIQIIIRQQDGRSYALDFEEPAYGSQGGDRGP